MLSKSRLLLFFIFLTLPENILAWQQEVTYTIQAELFPKTNLVEGKETLVYTNNSPDTLEEVYFHLYLNAFQPGSYMDKYGVRFGEQAFTNRPEKDWGKMEIHKLSVNKDSTVEYEINNTVLTIRLDKSIAPGEKTEFDFKFSCQIPPGGARMGRSGKHFDIAQWYPKIAVYDHKGWHNEQYIGIGEFYGEFATFTVDFTFPKEYVVGHTGILLNEKELFPDLPKATEDTILIDILSKYQEKKEKRESEKQIAKGSNSEEKSSDSKPDSLSAKRTWKMYAENVHDFALTADPNYIWDRALWQDVTINVLYIKGSPKEKYWKKKAAEYTRFCIKFLSDTFGKYPYTQFTTAQTSVGGGMEYPQLVFINRNIGSDIYNGLYGVIAHEAAHNWFYGIIGSNETAQAFMDEGFTSFATILAQEAYYGRYNNIYTWRNWYQKKFYEKPDTRSSSQISYLRFAKTGQEEPADTHSDRFLNPAAYRPAVYNKTAAVLFMLQYTLGDSVFDKAMKEYFQRWKFKHPYKEDFQKTMEDVSGQKLEWFFKQWFERTYTCDYAIGKIKNKKVTEEGSYKTKIKIYKKGPALMPLDVELKLRNGEKRTLSVPVEVWMNKEKEYSTTLNLPDKVVSAEINPDKRIADVNRLNNTWPLPKFAFNLDPPGPRNISHPYQYQILYNPSFWYNDVDGLKFGTRFKGSYMEYEHNFDLGLWYGPKSEKINVDFSFTEPNRLLGSSSNLYLRSFYLEGRKGGQITLSRNLRSRFLGADYGVSLGSVKKVSDAYIPINSNWDSGWQNFMTLFWSKGVSRKSFSTHLKVNFSNSILGSDFDYNKLTLESRTNLKFNQYLNFWARIYAGSSQGNLPSQSGFYLASAQPDQEFWNAYYRSKGTLPNTPRRNGHIYLPGGGNLRGFVNQNFSGRKIFATNFSWSAPNLFSLFEIKYPSVLKELTKIKMDVFLDVGQVWDNQFPSLKDFYSDWGVGFSYKIPYLDYILDETRIRLDLPLWRNRPQPGESRFKVDWILNLGAGIFE